MASTDGDYWLDRRHHSAPSIESFPKQQRALRAAKFAPTYSKIDLGQLVRTLALIALCFGVTQLPHADKPRSTTATALVAQ